MVACPYGSAPAGGSPPWFTYDDVYVAAKFGAFAGWLLGAATGLPSTPQATATLCATDPPTDLPTAADWLALAFPPIALATGAYARFGNWIKANKWNDLCACNLGPVTDPACGFTLAAGPVGPASAGGVPALNVNYSVDLVPVGSTPGDTFTCTYSQINFAHLTSGVDVQAFSYPSGTVLYSRTITTLAAGGATFAGTVAPGDNHVGFLIHPRSPTDSWVCNSITATDTGTNCAGTPYPYVPPALTAPPTGYPTGPVAATCSSSQDVCNALQLVADKIAMIKAQVDVIQKQGVPFGYTKGTGISMAGVGSTPVVEPLGVAVSMNNPAWVGGYHDNPATTWNAGTLSFETADGATESVPLRHADELFLGVPAFITAVAWSLPSGVTGTLYPLYAVGLQA
jgi:hypothetical protein